MSSKGWREVKGEGFEDYCCMEVMVGGTNCRF